MPRVSILMPVRDAEATLAAALRSVAAQTFRDWQLVAVDDGSADASLAMLQRTAGRNPRVRALARPPGGIVDALRVAADAASGELLARMDADDLMHPRRLELQVARMEAAPRVDVLASRVRLFGPTAEGMRRYVAWQNGLLTHRDIEANLFVECPIAHPTVLLRRAAFERAGGYRVPGWAEDYDLWQRMREAGARFEKLPEKLLAWRDGEGRLTRTHPMYSAKAFHAARLHYFLRDPRCRGPLVVWGAGPTGRAWVRDLLRAGVGVAAAIDIDPRKIGRRIADGAVRVVSVEEGLSMKRTLVLGAVGSRGARDLIRERLAGAGLAEGRDFLFAA